MNLELKTLLLSLFFRFLLASVVFLLGLAILLASGPAGAFMGFFCFWSLPSFWLFLSPAWAQLSGTT